MFTQDEKTILLDAILAKKSATERSKAKSKFPEFSPVYDKHLGVLASLAMKIQAMEVKDGAQGKVTSR